MASQGMQSRTLLMDPASSSNERCFFRIPAGIKFYANKVRLLNFNILNNDSQPVYYGPRGIYQIVKKISLLSVNGSEIDFLSNMDILSIKMLHLSNSSQYSLARNLMQNMGVSITAPSMSQIELTEAQGKADGTMIQAYIDIAFALDFLRQSYLLDAGYTIVIEWETDPEVHGIAGGYTFSTPPALAIDECLTGEPADVSPTVTYKTIISDRLYINPTAASTGEINQTQVRLNSFYNMFISSLYYYLDYDCKTNTAKNPYHLARSAPQEELSILVDGRKILMYKGVDTDARKAAMLHDFSGEFCLPGVAPAYFGVGRTLPLATDPSGVSGTFGLVNPNTKVIYNGVYSYGCVKLDQFVQIDLAVYYNYLVTGTPTIAEPAYLNTMAEVLRTYNKQTDMVSYVMQQGNVVNTM
tara:strand:- start:516 stop:1751 length:1236 start_codon:yes stop_codon:yes gene_type:complete